MAEHPDAIDTLRAARFAVKPPEVVEFLGLPPIDIPQLPYLEGREQQSAGVLIQCLADTILQWRDKVPPEVQPAIVALMNGGVAIRVDKLIQESHHGIRIEGRFEGRPCMVFTHQASVQLFCYSERVEDEAQRRKIAFIIDGTEWQI
jgi:hypothetical protein